MVWLPRPITTDQFRMAQAKVLTNQPPIPCDGYKDPRKYYPQDLSVKEVTWYFRALETDDPKITEIFHNIPFTTKIACAMFYHPHKTATTEDCLIPLDKSKPVVIVCHGYNTWRSNMLIVNLAAALAEELQCHTLRFDFTGEGHSTGDWTGSNYDGELNDVRSVVDFVQNHLGLRVAGIVGHNKGTISVFRYLLEEDKKAKESNKPSSVPCAVGLSGLFMTPDTPDQAIIDWFLIDKEQQEELEKNGSFRYPTNPWKEEYDPAVGDDREIKGQLRKQVFTKEDLQTRVDMNCVKDIKSPILTIYGGKDDTLAKTSATKYRKVPPNSEQRVLENADHEFNGTEYTKELSAIISEFVKKHAGL